MAGPQANLYHVPTKLIGSVPPKGSAGVTPLRAAPGDPRHVLHLSAASGPPWVCTTHRGLAGQPEATAGSAEWKETVSLSVCMLAISLALKYS